MKPTVNISYTHSAQSLKYILRIGLLSLLVIGLLNNLLSQSTPASGDILFTHVDADLEHFELITLKRINLSSLFFTDHGVCSSGIFRATEDSFGLTQFTQLNDIPQGTLVRISTDTSTLFINDLNPNEGIILVNVSSLDFATSGDQIISYVGNPALGNGSCVGSGTNTFISGINWGTTSGWITSGTLTSNSSFAPNTLTDIEIKNTLDAVWFSGSVTGTVANILSTSGSGVRNPTNWSGTNSGTGTFSPLKDIQFHQSNYLSGSVSASQGGNSTTTLALNNLTFSNTNSDTRYLVTLNENSTPSTPANRFTCYFPNSNYTITSNIVTAVSTPPCAGTTNGIGKVVYFGYGLPASLVITGLNNATCYYGKVYAINGNGYSSNFSSSPASFSLFTGSTTLVAY